MCDVKTSTCAIIACNATIARRGLAYCREHYLTNDRALLLAEIDEAEHAVGDAEHALIDAEDWLAALIKLKPKSSCADVPVRVDLKKEAPDA